jgi:hypothetical protein
VLQAVRCLFGRHVLPVARVDEAPLGFTLLRPGAPEHVGWYACSACGRPMFGTQRYSDLARQGVFDYLKRAP